MSTWAITRAELTSMLVSAALIAGGVLAWAASYGYPRSVFKVQGKWIMAGSVRFRELERDRVLASAKGIGATASGFVVTLVTGCLKGRHHSDRVTMVAGRLHRRRRRLHLVGRLDQWQYQSIRPERVGRPR